MEQNAIPRLRPTTLLCACEHVHSGFPADELLTKSPLDPANEIDPLALLGHEARARLSGAWLDYADARTHTQVDDAGDVIEAIELAAQARYKGAGDGE